MLSLPKTLSRTLPFYYGWIVVAVGFLTLGMGATVRTMFSLLFPPIIAEFGWERGLTASVFSLGFVVAALSFPLLGAWIDKYGPQVVLSGGAIATAAGFLLTTVSSEPWHFYATLGLMVIGASTAFAYNGHFVFVPSWFERRRGLALGIISGGAGLVSILLIPELQRLIDRGGWRTGCYVMAALLVALVVPINVLFQRRRPEALGLVPDGGAASPASGNARRVLIVDRVWAETEWTLASAARTARFWCFGLAFFLGLFSWYAILVHQTKYLIDLGFSTTFAAWALGLVPVFGVAGQLTLGVLADRIGREWVWTMACGGFCVCYVAMYLLARNPDPALVWIMIIAQGFLGYGMTPAIGSIPADLFQGRNYGRIFGVLAVFGSSGAAFGPWAFGVIFDRTGSYDHACLLVIAMSLASAVLIWLAAPRKVRRVGTSSVA